MIQSCIPRIAAAFLICATSVLGADPYAIKTTKLDPPEEVKKPIRDQLDATAIQFTDDKGKVLADVWFRSALPANASEAQVKKGISLQQLPKGVLLGVIRFHQKMGDYRKQQPKPGTYVMRLAFQPMDGDHMGTAPIGSFVLLTRVGDDKGEATVDEETLVERSGKASGTTHPTIWLLLPAAKDDVADKPVLKKKIGTHWVIYVRRDVTLKGEKKGTIGFGLTLIGFSSVA